MTVTDFEALIRERLDRYLRDNYGQWGFGFYWCPRATEQLIDWIRSTEFPSALNEYEVFHENFSSHIVGYQFYRQGQPEETNTEVHEYTETKCDDCREGAVECYSREELINFTLDELLNAHATEIRQMLRDRTPAQTLAAAW